MQTPRVLYLEKSAASAASLEDFPSCGQVGCQRSLPEDQNPGIQGSLAVSVVRQPSRRLLAPLDSWILFFGEAALAADLITAWKTFRGGCTSSRLIHGHPKIPKNI